MVRVLFVCAGNICRSPMAEAIFRHLVQEAGLTAQFEIASAGTGDWHVGEPIHRGTRAILDQHGIAWGEQRARHLIGQDLLNFDYILVMDQDNLADVQILARRVPAKGKIARLTDYADVAIAHGRVDVPDPFYSGGFDAVYALVHSGCVGLLRHIQQEHQFTERA